MALFRKKAKPEEAERPTVTDDFIYDDPDAGETDAPSSETPEEALRHLRGSRSGKAASSSGKAEKEARSEPPSLFEEEEVAPPPEKEAYAEAESLKKGNSGRKVYSSGIMLDDNLQPIAEGSRRERKRHPVLRGIAIGLITFVLLFCTGAYILNRYVDLPVLGEPESAISRFMTPVQTFFSGLTDSFFSYMRSWKLRSNLETAYEELRAENEQLVYKAMLADELQQTLSQYEDLSDEIKANREMKPVVCSIIGKSDSNYFATFKINKGAKDGLEEYMAVTISGALVGYTESVEEDSAVVRSIIDSEASIAGLIQSSRDQGTVRGTLGIDGTALCRMYYLPDDNLPRPGDLVVTSGVGMKFPKGIPIGVVRESTRGMDSNKQYIVLEPQVDFQHLEYVIVLCYKPKTAEPVQGRSQTSRELMPLESAFPEAVVPQIASSLFESQSTEDPNATESPTPEPTETPTPSPTPSPSPEPTPDVSNLAYQVVSLGGEPTPSPTPTLAPTATPYFTPDPGEMTFEEDE